MECEYCNDMTEAESKKSCKLIRLMFCVWINTTTPCKPKTAMSKKLCLLDVTTLEKIHYLKLNNRDFVKFIYLIPVFVLGKNPLL